MQSDQLSSARFQRNTLLKVKMLKKSTSIRKNPKKSTSLGKTTKKSTSGIIGKSRDHWQDPVMSLLTG